MLEKETQKHIRLENLLRMLYQNPVSSNPVFSIWSPGFLLSSPGFLKASPSTSPGFSRVRIFFGSESKSESESGPGFEVCPRPVVCRNESSATEMKDTCGNKHLADAGLIKVS